MFYSGSKYIPFVKPNIDNDAVDVGGVIATTLRWRGNIKQSPPVAVHVNGIIVL